MFMETSAKAGHNVKSLFKKIAMSLPGMEKDTQTEPNTSAFAFCFSFFHPHIVLGPEIDVTTTAAGEVPQASSCC